MSFPESAPLRVLLVDDHELVRLGLRLVLEGLAGIGEVIDVPDASAALAVLEERAVDVAVVDVRMPLVSGAALTREIKSTYPGLPVLGLTMAYDEHLADEMLQAGAVAVVEKTIDTQSFAKAVRNAARQAA